jgi:hypothetical protein
MKLYTKTLRLYFLFFCTPFIAMELQDQSIKESMKELTLQTPGYYSCFSLSNIILVKNEKEKYTPVSATAKLFIPDGTKTTENSYLEALKKNLKRIIDQSMNTIEKNISPILNPGNFSHMIFKQKDEQTGSIIFKNVNAVIPDNFYITLLSHFKASLPGNHDPEIAIALKYDSSNGVLIKKVIVSFDSSSEHRREFDIIHLLKGDNKRIIDAQENDWQRIKDVIEKLDTPMPQL